MHSEPHMCQPVSISFPPVANPLQAFTSIRSAPGVIPFQQIIYQHLTASRTVKHNYCMALEAAMMVYTRADF